LKTQPNLYLMRSPSWGVAPPFPVCTGQPRAMAPSP
jgi:hypothetical protein